MSYIKSRPHWRLWSPKSRQIIVAESDDNASADQLHAARRHSNTLKAVSTQRRRLILPVLHNACVLLSFYIGVCEQLIVFSNAVEMSAIALEGLIAYRVDVKQLFYRDNVTWRPIRVSRLTISLINE